MNNKIGDDIKRPLTNQNTFSTKIKEVGLTYFLEGNIYFTDLSINVFWCLQWLSNFFDDCKAFTTTSAHFYLYFRRPLNLPRFCRYFTIVTQMYNCATDLVGTRAAATTNSIIFKVCFLNLRDLHRVVRKKIN